MTYSQHNNLQIDNEFINQIIDYRNGHYQGSAHLYSRKPNGKGMFLDQNYLFVLSDWIDGLPSGRTVAIFPNNHMFYGSLLSNRPNKLCAYKQPQKYTIYFKNFISQNHIAIIDDYLSQSILVLYVNYKEWCKFTQAQRKNKLVFIQKQPKTNKLIQVVTHRVYASEEQKWKLIEQYFKEKVQVQYQNYSTFIRSSYEANKQNTLFSRQNQTEYELGYEGSSIVCKIDKNQNLEEDYTIKLMGIYNQEDQLFEIYKKNKSKDKTQEFIKGISSITYSQRPKTCISNLRQYYKKSTIFCNSFVNTNTLNQLQLFFIAISQYVDYFLTNKYAQVFIFKSKANEQIPSIGSNKSKESHASFKSIEQQRQISKNKINEKYSKCESLYQNQKGIYTRVKVFNYQNEQNQNQNEHQKKEGLKQRKKTIKPLSQINSCFSSNLNLVNTDLRSLTKHLQQIEQQIKKSNHQTPPKSCKHSNSNLSQTKQIPSPKLNTSVHSHKMSSKQSNISVSQAQLKKSTKSIWR